MPGFKLIAQIGAVGMQLRLGTEPHPRHRTASPPH